MKKFLKGLLVVGIILFFIPVFSIKAEAEDNTIAEGVWIGDVDVSGMTTTQASESVNKYIADLSNHTITLIGKSGETLDITVSELGLTWSNPEIVSEALGLGKEGNVIERYKALKDLKYSTHNYNIEYSFDETALASIMERAGNTFNVEKENYSLKKDGNTFTVVPGQSGLKVNAESSITALKEYIQNEWNHQDASFELVVEEDVAEGSAEELSQVKDVLGTFSTSYKTSGNARSANVANGCSLINGTTLYPGEEFSVLDTITPFTEENGYYPAGSYLNGVVVESIGGGICQVSTTLYNAVLLAELEVTERHNHSMIINYVDPSADAAIAENGGKNFKFVNSSDYPIYIEGYTSNKVITFVIYGKETRDSNRKVSYESEVLETTAPGPDQINADASSPIGSISTQSAHTGYKAQLVKIVKVDGVEQSREVVNKSTYKMVPKIISVGTATADPTAAAQIGTAIATGDINQVTAVANAIAAQAAAAATQDPAAIEAANAAAAAAADSAAQQLAAQQAAAAAAAQAETTDNTQSADATQNTDAAAQQAAAEAQAAAQAQAAAEAQAQDQTQTETPAE